MTCLYYWSFEKVTLNDLIEKVASSLGEPTYGLFYSPGACRLLIRRADGFVDHSGKKPDLGDVYEARIFSETGEARWVESGCGVALAEKKLAGLGEPTSQKDREKNEIGYLLWGQGTGASDGKWSKLATSQIGTLHVPVPGVGKLKYVRLKAVEYFDEDECGNLSVSDERICGFEVAR